MIPKVIFRYSWIYDEVFKELKGKKRSKYPSRVKIFNYIEKLEKTWRKNEKEILKEIAKSHGLRWQERFIYCYLTTEGLISFSEPTTLLIYSKNSFRKIDFVIDILTHELIHRIISPKENWQRCEKAWEYIDRKYKKESFTTKIHIRIHAVHSHIYLKFYGKKRLERDIEWMQKYRDYKRAWGIVQKEGYQNIIKEFRKRIK